MLVRSLKFPAGEEMLVAFFRDIRGVEAPCGRMFSSTVADSTGAVTSFSFSCSSFCCAVRRARSYFLHIAIVHCSTEAVKIGEKGLREIRLDSPALVVDIMIGSIVGEDPVDRVIWECIAAMVQNGLDGGAGEEPHRLAHCHTSEQVRDAGAKSVKCESFEGVVV